MSNKKLIRVGHSPDSDDAFMFHALTNGKLDTGNYEFRHELCDIESLNRRAFHGELELTAVSVHAYTYLNDVYALCNCGASMGDKYGPIVVSSPKIREKRGKKFPDDLETILIPGRLTTATLVLKLWLEKIGKANVRLLDVPFDSVFEHVQNGSFEGEPVDAGVVIHEGQLTYTRENLERVVDLGVWWMEETGLPLPLGANAVRRDLTGPVIADVVRLLHASIKYGLENRNEALDYALQFGRDLKRDEADEFVGMYVNDWTLDFGDVGRQAVKELLKRAYDAEIVPKRVVPDFV
ncbi:MAG: ABC transporter substrate-binding protein [Planctomycetaceae bacterium]|nr:ABC transporter substrate-binding protein [Planctomycetaceae bacterium]